MAIVYKHIRLDKNEVFYIGIGVDEKRAFVKNKRSQYWKNVVNITEYKVEIIEKDLSYEEAIEKEIELIKFYGRKDLGLGTLVNMTDGGDGTVNWIVKQETKDKISNTLKGRTIPEDVKQKVINSLYGRKSSKEKIEKLRNANLSDKNPMFGKTGSLNVNSKKVVQIDIKTNEIIKVWESISLSAKLWKYDI